MLRQIIFDKSDILKYIFKFFIVSLLCFITTALSFSIGAAVISRTNFSYDILPTVTAAILAVSAIIDGFLISKWNKENGLIWGVLAGIVITVFVIVASFKFETLFLSAQIAVKCAITVTAGAIGGIIGVNTN